MRGLLRLSRFLEGINKLAGCDLLKFVISLGFFPLLKLRYLLLKFIFLVNERRGFLLECQCVHLEIRELFQNIRLSLHDCMRIISRL